MAVAVKVGAVVAVGVTIDVSILANGGTVVGVGGTTEAAAAVAVGVGELVGISEAADTVFSSSAPCISRRAGAERSMPQPSAIIAVAPAISAARVLRFVKCVCPAYLGFTRFIRCMQSTSIHK